ncbi:hypothetical protein Q9R08_12330 [Microbacterium sp. QXD-8]|uniref:NodB homology domain-containing protein n=1 Tax=Microbacterium psychrotolerans TaxID=3068321 RepID=A0ABU0Z2G4_9MICO|nr:hypothetical protein [Microbacterium sp. QXD-8]MDQ7878768.1 hypothetical protein [Microbacterium sp. QXD-8]
MHEAFVTVDVDWAPDWAMQRLLAALVENDIRSTWFVTHETPVLDDLRARPDLVELGIHPNFQPASSHGNTPSEVLTECLRIVPEARTMRTHCLVQSTPILQTVVDQSEIAVDSSIYLRDATDVRVSELALDRDRSIARVPYVWEDDLEFFCRQPRWDAMAFLRDRDSEREITVMDVHPIHFVLNSADVKPYQALKSSIGDTRLVTEEQVRPFVHAGGGTAGFIASLAAARRQLDIEFGTPLGELSSRINLVRS